eukprot:CAMPEP_0119017434 /NCGR_PEP_ID=MMETSP1176-20130426/16552_1 /TAXON_ID=265551 /ORGANISM="Synedropsis recta cf, Strain CCMP1620" /LENGTH=339 /DNA_ID=CAMNT_0006971161 /DNA_START=361 /DNA_END=1377 /DNA_ORIENTATION=-
MKNLFSSGTKQASSGAGKSSSSASKKSPFNIELSSSSNSNKKASSSSSSNNSNKHNMGCCARLWAEFKHPWFVLTEVNGRIIDVSRSFAPEPKRWVVAVKLILTVWVYQVLAFDLTVTDNYNDGNLRYYLIYLTHWAFLAALLYFPLSLMVSLFGNKVTSQPPAVNDDGTSNALLQQQPSFLVRLVWGLFSTTATLQLSVSLLFWLLEYDRNYDGMPSYSSIMKHGGIMILLLLEGLVVNKIPVRVRHVVIVEVVSLVYLIWTVLHAKLGIGNVFSNGGDDDEVNDDVIYGVINWNDAPLATLMTVAMVLLVALPILFLLLWTASQWRRRYVGGEENDG